MTSITLKVNGAEIRASVTGTLTSGMVGIPVTIEYDEAWEGLTKNLVCRCSKSGFDDEEYRSILNVGNISVVAHEVMQAGKHLWLGVEGYSPDGTLVIPTTWAMCGVIQRGANTGDDLSADPTLPVWGQLQAQIDRLECGSIPPEQLEEIRACAGAAAQAEENAAAASRLAADHADTARANGEAAQIYMENARTSAASAANMANDAFRYQTAAEAAAERAEDAVNVEMTAALADYFSHVMPQFDDANGLVYVNAVLTALGAEPRGEGGGSGGGEIPNEPDQPGGEGGGTTGDTLPTDGLMAYFDLRNLGDKANVTVGTTKGVVATQGNGALYSWASQPITSSDEYGVVLPRGLLYNPSGQSAEYDMGDHFTMVVTTRGAPSGWNMTGSNVLYGVAEPVYVTADGTAKAAKIEIAGDNTGYNTQTYRINGETQTMYLNGIKIAEYVGSETDGFVKWESKPTFGTIWSAGTVVAATVYNRPLSETEIVEVQAFMKSLEVTA